MMWKYGLRVFLISLILVLVGCEGDHNNGNGYYYKNGIALQSIALTPANSSIPKGLTTQMTATGTYSDGTSRDITSEVMWYSGSDAVSIDENGLGEAQSVGMATITAGIDDVNGSTSLTVTPAELKSISVAPADISIPKGLSRQLTATGSYSDGTSMDITTDVSWQSDRTEIVSVDGDGLGHAEDVGMATVTASLAEVTGSTSMIVTTTELESITLAPDNASIPKGLTQAMRATGNYTDGSTVNITADVTWQSDNTEIVTIDGDGSGHAEAVGTATITASLAEITGSTSLTVTAVELTNIAITPEGSSVPKGLTQQMTATGSYTDGMTADITSNVTWRSETTDIVTVNGTGLGSALDMGSATITASLGDITGSTDLTVTAAVLESIAITPEDVSIPKGRTQQMTATGSYSDGASADITTEVSWVSDAIDVATIDKSGLGNAVEMGAATITAEFGEVSASSTLAVTEAVWQNLDGAIAFVVALKSDGSQWGWGNNFAGQLGDGTTTRSLSPVQGTIGMSWKQVNAGIGFTVAIKSDGTLWAWGQNDYGQLGNGTTTNSLVPVNISSEGGWIKVVAGVYHTLAIKSDGTLWAWGYNNYGQLGNGTTVDSTVPIQIGSDSDWIDVDTKQYHVVAIKSDGTLWAWGQNNLGQLGDGTKVDKHIPTQIGSEMEWERISAGDGFSFAIKENGTLWSWGSNAYGQLGDGTTTASISPHQVGEEQWNSVSAGLHHTLAIQSNGTLWAWGNNSYGELGDGTTVNKYEPVIIGTEQWESIFTHSYYSLARKSDETLWGWGRNNGVFGNGTSTNSLVPVVAGEE